MPIYDYQCSSCHHSDEVMRKVSASSETEHCPACGEQAFSKQLSAPSFKLNGTGWYATDFKNNQSKPDANKTSAAKTESSESSGTSTDDGNSCAPGCGCH